MAPGFFERTHSRDVTGGLGLWRFTLQMRRNHLVAASKALHVALGQRCNQNGQRWIAAWHNTVFALATSYQDTDGSMLIGIAFNDFLYDFGNLLVCIRYGQIDQIR